VAQAGTADSGTGASSDDAGSSSQAGTGAAGTDAGADSCGPPCGEPAGYAVGCCGGQCTGLYNDPFNCGECDNTCSAAVPYCSNGECAAPPCNAASCADGETCCGATCCAAGQICCGVNNGPFFIECHTPTAEAPTCPIGCPSCACAAPDTAIATPDGERPIASLAVGDLVYSVDHEQLTVVPIARVARTPAIGHHVVRVTLATGAVLEISARHPTADGRSFADLRQGAELDGLEIVNASVIPYAHAFTYDILPASDSGTYYAAGALIGSTLR
jgi:hypothetical protein